MKTFNILFKALCLCMVLTICSGHSLCHEIKNLAKAIPFKSFAAIVENHNKYDKKFQKATNFMQTSKFATISSQIEQSSVYQNALQIFENAGIDTTDMETISEILNCFSKVYSDSKNAITSPLPDAVPTKTFFEDFNDAIDLKKLHKEIAKRSAKSEQFKNFIKILSDPDLETKVWSGVRPNELQLPLYKLKRNGINVKHILENVRDLLEDAQDY